MHRPDKNISNINSLSYGFTVLSKWFCNNFMALNPDKCLFMLLDIEYELRPN